jgi:hypothetical protein
MKIRMIVVAIRHIPNTRWSPSDSQPLVQTGIICGAFNTGLHPPPTFFSRTPSEQNAVSVLKKFSM